jgi:membrane associated rhomboid family serine protease
MKRLCPQHGLVEAVIDGTCAICGAPSLDPEDPANRATIRAGRAVRRKQGAAELAGTLLAVGFVFSPFVMSRYTKNADVIAFVPISILLGFVVISAVVASLHRPAIPGARLRFWTSATVISAAVCLVFVAVKRRVGIEQLWFGRANFAEPWRLVTASFTHGGAAHIGGNMIALAIFGPPVDRRVGRLRTAIILAAGTVVGLCAQAAYTAEPSVGFSAAIYGLFGATLVLMARRPQLLTISMVTIPMPTWAWMVVTVPLYTLLVLSDNSAHVGWVAHLGGFVAGALVALPMRRVPESEEFIAHEQARKARFETIAQQGLVNDLDSFGAAETATPVDAGAGAGASSALDAEMAAFHRATRRRQIIAVAVGGVAMFVFGLAAATLATWMKAPAMVQGRKIGTIGAGLVMMLVGGEMLRQAVRIARATKP